MRVEMVEDRRAEECQVAGLEEEDRRVGDDPGEAGMFAGNEAEEAGEEEDD